MKTKELKNLAKKFAKLERIIQTTENQEEKKKAEDEIISLSGHVTSLEDITIIDEMVQDLLAKNIWLFKNFLL